MRTYEEVRKQMCKTHAEAVYRILTMDPREAAEKAFLRGGPPIEEIEAWIRAEQTAARAACSKKPEVAASGQTNN